MKQKIYDLFVKISTWFLIGAFVLATVGCFLVALKWVLSLLGVI